MRFLYILIIRDILYMEINEEDLVIIIKANSKGKKFRYIEVTCDGCNKDRLQRIDKFRNRKSNLCLRCNARRLKPDNRTHGKSATKLYHKYHNLVHRCYNVNSSNFHYYGGRGIGVCDTWLDPENGLENFYKWALDNGYTEENNLQIDRIDNDGDYSPDNCQFISKRANLEKMENLFGVKGRVVKRVSPKNSKGDYHYQSLVDNLKLVEKDTGSTLAHADYVPLWDFLENLGKKKSTNKL